MKHCAPLCDIDLLTFEHCIDTLAQARRLCQFQEQLYRFISYTVLRIVKVDANSFESKTLASMRIFCKERSQMQVACLMIMFLELLPGGAMGQRCRIY